MGCVHLRTWLTYGPSKINSTRSLRMDPYRQQQEEEHAETTYGRFIHW